MFSFATFFVQNGVIMIEVDNKKLKETIKFNYIPTSFDGFHVAYKMIETYRQKTYQI